MAKKYHIITYGCQMNKSDSEKIASVLEKKKYKKTSEISEADLIVINACSVRQSAIDRIYSKINKLKNKKIILAGCLLSSDKKKLKNKVSEFWHPDKYFNCRPIHKNKLSAYVPIMTGCNNFCAYCVVPYTRGREYSRPAKKIIQEIRSLIKKGYKEIILIGQNVNSYEDTPPKNKKNQKTSMPKIPRSWNFCHTDFPALLKMINNIPGNFKIGFLTSHPKDMSDKLIKIMAESEKFNKYLNLPVQSGDNEILKKMNRNYTTEDYKKLVKKIRKKIPDINLSTDVIVGFPGETKKQFENTAKLFRKIKFNIAYIAKYSPRPGTTAYKLKDNVSIQEKKKREKVLREIIEKNSKIKM